MTTLRRDPGPRGRPENIYSDQGKPNSTAQTDYSRRLQLPGMPVKPISAKLVMDDQGWPLSVEPIQLQNPVPGSGTLTCVHMTPDGKALLVGTSDGIIYESANLGISWTVGLDTGDSGRCINGFADDTTNNDVYAAADGGSGYGRVYKRAASNGAWSTDWTSGEKNVKAIWTRANSLMVCATTDTTNNAKIFGSGPGSWTAKITLGDTGVCAFAEAIIGAGSMRTNRMFAITTGSGTHTMYECDVSTWTSSGAGNACPINPYNNLFVGVNPFDYSYPAGPSLHVWDDSARKFKQYDATNGGWTTTEPVETFIATGDVIGCVFNHNGAAYASIVSQTAGKHLLLRRATDRWVPTQISCDWAFGAANMVTKGTFKPYYETRYFVPHSSLGHRYIYATGRRQLIY